MPCINFNVPYLLYLRGAGVIGQGVFDKEVVFLGGYWALGLLVRGIFSRGLWPGPGVNARGLLAGVITQEPDEQV